jgi:chaperonin GroES
VADELPVTVDNSELFRNRAEAQAETTTMAPDPENEPVEYQVKDEKPAEEFPETFADIRDDVIASLEPTEPEEEYDLIPLGDRVLVERVEADDTYKGRLFIPEMAKEKPQQGFVLAIGGGRRLENGTIIPIGVAVGERVVFGKYSGAEMKLNGNTVWLMREDEILGILRPKPELAALPAAEDPYREEAEAKEDEPREHS